MGEGFREKADESLGRQRTRLQRAFQEWLTQAADAKVKAGSRDNMFCRRSSPIRSIPVVPPPLSLSSLCVSLSLCRCCRVRVVIAGRWVVVTRRLLFRLVIKSIHVVVQPTEGVVPLLEARPFLQYTSVANIFYFLG